MSRLLSLWRNLVHRDRVERDLDDEMRATLELLVAEKVRAGMRPEDARRSAMLEIGGVEAVKEQVRDAKTGALVDAALWDIRYAARLLRRNPVFTLTAAVSLAIGIGANTTIFTIANALLFRAPVGVADSGRLVDIFRTQDGNMLADPTSFYPVYQEVRQRATTLDGVYAFQVNLEPMSMRGPGDANAERVFGDIVSANYFTVLGVRAAAGRLFGSGDSEQPGASPIAVLSHRFWTRRFGADPTLVGQTLQLNSQPFTVVGVAAEGFVGSSVLAADVWVPAAMAQVVRPGNLMLTGLLLGGRLKPGVSMTQAAAEVDVLGRALMSAGLPMPVPMGPGPRESGAAGLSLAAASPVPGNLRLILAGFLALLMGLVSIVLVIACANVAGVLLARAAARRREIAVRLAMGAGRARLVRQLLTETLLLFGVGGAAGLVLARVMTSLLVSLLPAFPLPVGISLPLDTRVVAFTAGLSLVAAVLSGLAPALQASRADLVSALKDDSQGPSDRLRLRSAFVIAQVAFSILLVVAGGLLVQAQGRVTAIDQGFDSRGIEVATLDLSMAGYTNATGPDFARELIDRLRQVPGVQAATLADRVPGPAGMSLGGLTVPGVTPPNGQAFFSANWTIVEPGYFDALRLPLVAGRDFGAADRAGTPPVVILAERTARQFWPGRPSREAVGEHVLWQPFVPPGAQNPPQPRNLLVVGVVRDVRNSDPRAAAAVYEPFAQRYRPDMTILARATEGQRLASEIRTLVASMNPSLPILSSQTLEDEMIGPVEIQLRVAASVSSSIGLVGVLLAAIGIYGVTAYAFARRTREIGIRMALGANRGAIVRMVLTHGMSLVAIGSVIGLILAAGASQVLTRLLFGVPPLDLVTFGGAAMLFAAIGLAACYVPARRATRIDPIEALRSE